MKIPRWQMFLIWAVSLVFLFSGCSGSSGTGPVSTPTASPSPAVSPTPAGSPSPTPTPTLPVRNITQGTQYATIQAAINGAHQGDEIVVSPGTYYENIDFKGKNITVRSENPQDSSVIAQTVIDGRWRGSAVTFKSGEGNGAILNGFTIQNGTGTEDTWPSGPGGMIPWTVYLGGGIYIRDSSPTVMHSVIWHNEATCGGGLYVEGDSAPWIVDNTIENNQSQYTGGGIGVRYSAFPVIHQNLVRNNQAQDFGGGIYVDSSASVKTASYVPWPRDNCPPGGLWSPSSNTWTYRNNTFSGNTHQNGQTSNGCHVYFD